MSGTETNREPDPVRLRELFAIASDMKEPERRAFLDRNCEGQPAVRAELESLFRADLAANESALWHSNAAGIEASHLAAEESLPFERLGEYRILSRIGSGGMGAVYLAERDYDDVRRRVAVKVIPRAIVDEESIRRFRQERQILARLEHPNIARMLDAGRTADGLPYLAMEYVDGVPLDEYCASRVLTPRARVDLFEAICAAVAAAHRNLVVHRDLKPRNILIDAEGTPKLLDFGIAKLMDEATDGETTRLLMTPRYASPEQVAGGPITTASDIYSLGAILQELMAGANSSPDLETVIAMARREEPERRYSSATELAADVRRAVEGYPVRARADTLGYRLRRLAARRPWEAAAGVFAALALAVLGAVAFDEYRASEQRFADVRRMANSFLFDVYDAIGGEPGVTQARMLVARRAQEYLDVLARYRSNDPKLRLELANAYKRLGDILGQPFTANLGDFTGALANYRNAAAILEGLAASNRGDAALLQAWSRVMALEGHILIRQGEFEHAVAAAGKAVELSERAAVLKTSHDARYAVVNERLFLVLAQLEFARNRYDTASFRTAESLADNALRAALQISAESPADDRSLGLAAKAYEYHGYVEGELGQNAGDPAHSIRAVRDMESYVSLVERLYGANPTKYRRNLPDSQADLSNARLNVGDSVSAERLARESLRGFEEIAASDSRNAEAERDVMVAHWRLAKALAQEKLDTAAAGEFGKTLAGYEELRRKNPAEPYDGVIIESRDRMAAYRLSAGEPEAARRYWRENIDMLTNSSTVPDQAALALDLGLLGGATAASDSGQAKLYYERAAQIWERMRSSGKLPARYAAKADEMRRATATLAAASRR